MNPCMYITNSVGTINLLELGFTSFKSLHSLSTFFLETFTVINIAYLLGAEKVKLNNFFNLIISITSHGYVNYKEATVLLPNTSAYSYNKIYINIFGTAFKIKNLNVENSTEIRYKIYFNKF